MLYLDLAVAVLFVDTTDLLGIVSCSFLSFVASLFLENTLFYSFSLDSLVYSIVFVCL